MTRTQSLASRWVAAGAVVLAFAALAFPAAARPLLSALAGGLLAVVVTLSIDELRARTPEPSATSPFEPRRRTTEQLPAELARLTHGMAGLRPQDRLPEPTYWALRRRTYDRLRLRDGDVLDDPAHLAVLSERLSPQLYGVLVTESSRNVVRGHDLDRLITEVERL